MKLQKVSCNKCGNLLGIKDSTKYVTCGSCNAALEVVTTENSYSTIERKAHTSSKSFNQKREQSTTSDTQVYAEIEMLDRAWNNNLPNFMVKGTLPDLSIRTKEEINS